MSTICPLFAIPRKSAVECSHSKPSRRQPFSFGKNELNGNNLVSPISCRIFSTFSFGKNELNGNARRYFLNSYQLQTFSFGKNELNGNFFPLFESGFPDFFFLREK